MLGGTGFMIQPSSDYPLRGNNPEADSWVCLQQMRALVHRWG